jgi:PilZ domain
MWYAPLLMPSPKSERRSGQRVSARVPVSVGSPKSEPANGFTRDLSFSGIFLYSDSEILEGSDLEMVLMLPPELTNGEKRWVCCQASVIRVEPGGKDGRFGVAASIQTMESLPEILG